MSGFESLENTYGLRSKRALASPFLDEKGSYSAVSIMTNAYVCILPNLFVRGLGKQRAFLYAGGIKLGLTSAGLALTLCHARTIAMPEPSPCQCNCIAPEIP